MSMKNIIYIVIAAVIIGVAGYFAYHNLSGGGTTEPSELVGITTGEVSTPAPILTHGKTLDFQPIEKYNAQQQTFAYPVVSPDETGLPLPALIK